MNRALKTALDVGIAGLKTANDIGFMPPGAAVVTSIVNAIVENCNQVRVHQSECTIIRDKVVRLYNLYEEQIRKLAGTPMADTVSEVQGKLVTIRDRLSTFASWGFLRCFRNDSYIAHELKKSITEIDDTIQTFMVTGISFTVSSIGGADGLNEQLKHGFGQVKDKLARLPEEVALQIMLHVAHINGVHALEMTNPELQNLNARALTYMNHVSTTIADPTRKQIMINNTPVDRVAAANFYADLMGGAGVLHEWIRAGPAVDNLNGHVTKSSDLPYSGGTITDVFQGWYLGKYKVAIKSIRNAQVIDQSLQKRVKHEVNLWRHLKHENILPLLGVCTDLGAYICLISEWQEKGNLLEYSRKNPNADRLRLLIGAAEGICYLHDQQVVHANLKCSKILVGEGEKALVSDFQMSKVMNTALSTGFSVTIQASARWCAPEYSDDIGAHAPADVYSFAMAMLECFTLERPFNNMRREVEVNSHIIRGGRPARPTEYNPWLSDSVWGLMEECWQFDYTKRPTMREVLQRLEGIAAARRQV